MTIDYQKFLDEAMLEFIGKILNEIKVFGQQNINLSSGDNHSFYISFKTTDPLVKISQRVRLKFPDEITIVLQYQYEELIVEDRQFSVKISFDNIKEKVVIPFRAITKFSDPITNFSLQFNYRNYVDKEAVEVIDSIKLPQKKTSTKKDKASVITLDKFRKKKKD